MDSSPELAGLGEYGYEQMMGYPVQIPDPVIHDTADRNSENYNCLVCTCIILILVSILCTMLYFLKIK